MQGTASYPRGSGSAASGLMIFIFGALLALAGLGLAGGGELAPPSESPYTPEWWNRDRLDDLPFTQHALEAHPERALGAVEIRELMDRKTCKPLLVYICAAEQQAILTCPYPGASNGELLVALVVGLMRGPIIVTGYPGRDSYWQGNLKKQGCMGPYLVP